jgi:hypothetical protein
MEAKTTLAPTQKKIIGKQIPPWPHTHTCTPTKEKRGRLKEGLGDERRVQKIVTFGIYILSKGCSYILHEIGKHHLLRVINQVLMIVLFDASIKI